MASKYRACGTPGREALALHGPAENIYTHLDTIDRHHKYWSGKEHDARQAVDLAMIAMSNVLHDELSGSTLFFKLPVPLRRNPERVEQDRQSAIATLGSSMLLRQLIKPDRHYEDAIGLGSEAATVNSLLLDVVGSADAPIYRRVHVMGGDASDLLGDWQEEGQSDAWYEGTALFVHRVRPAEPSEVLLADIAGRVTFDFANMETLYPYLKNG